MRSITNITFLCGMRGGGSRVRADRQEPSPLLSRCWAWGQCRSCTIILPEIDILFTLPIGSHTAQIDTGLKHVL